MRGLIPELGAPRVLALAILVTAVGNGMYVTGSILFFTRSIGLHPVPVGAGLTVAGLAGLAAGPVVGHIADLGRPRDVYLVTLTGEGVATGALVMVHSFAAFLVSVCLISIAEQASRAVRGALIAHIGGSDRARFRMYLRSVTNLGLSVGAAGAGIAIALGTRQAYLALIAIDAVSFFLTAATVARLPGKFGTSRPPRSAVRFLAFRDGSYCLITALYGVLSMQYLVLTVVLPLWITEHTSAPRWLVAPAIMMNTVLVVLLQMRVGRGVDTVPKGVAITRRASVIFLLSCSLFAATAGLPDVLAVCGLLAAVAVHTLGEMAQTAGEFELSFGLAPEYAQGQYQGVFGMGRGICMVSAPFLLIMLCVRWGWPGWLILGGIFTAVGAVLGPMARRAQSNMVSAA